MALNQRSMDRVYRVMQDGETFYAVERSGDLRRAVLRDGQIFGGYELGAAVRGGLGAVKLLAPLEPLIFFKPSTAVLDPGGTIKLPPGVGRVDYEAELAVVIGRRAHRVPGAAAWDYILGLTCVNDVTARDLQNRDSQYTRCKGFDTFAPVGPSIAVGLGGPGRTLSVQTWLNGERRQASNTAQLIFGIEALVEFITFVMTLEPG